MSWRTVTQAVLVVVAVIVGVTVFRWRAHGHQVNYGDMPTWLAVGAAVIGAAVALRQLRDQQKVIADQTRQLERQQADQVDVALCRSDMVPPGTHTNSAGHHKCWMAEVFNGSRRPIRNVDCRIEPAAGQGQHSAAQVGELIRSDGLLGPGRRFHKVDAPTVRVLRAGAKAGLAFPFVASDYPDARVTARFTDDAGLHWEIRPDLHLGKLTNRSDWLVSARYVRE
jgi:hypothetical protein